MSSKQTIIGLPCCHIYRDYVGVNGVDTLVVSVEYGSVEDDGEQNDYIEVGGGSEFANLMCYLLKGKTEEELIKACKGNNI